MDLKHEEFGTADDYLRAFKTIVAKGIPDKHVELLRAHFAAPERTVTWAQLAAEVGYANGPAVNLQYGTLARRVAHLLGIKAKPRGFWLNVLTDWAEEADALTGHTAFVLRRPVVDALSRIGLLAGPAFELLPHELEASLPISEGAVRKVLVNAYERKPEARRRCIAAHGSSCCICGFEFAATYGPEAAGYIQVHHLRPLSEIGAEYVVDPVNDLRPVCPNCHAVVHLGGGCRSLDEVRMLLAQQDPTRGGS